MMNQKTLVRLGAATLIAVVAAFAIDRSRQPVSEFSGQAGRLADDLQSRVNDVNRVVLSTANAQTTVTLARKDGAWSVLERGGYPADVGKLREYLLKLADANLIEQKTSNKDRYADLGVTDISDATAKGVEVRLEGLPAPFAFIAGVFNAQGSGTYVRRSDQAQSWLAKGNLVPDKTASGWLRKDLADIPGDRIESVTIMHADGQSLSVSRKTAGDARYDVAGVPKGRELSSEFAANGLASVLADLRIDDVAPMSEVGMPDARTKARYRTFDGLVVDAGEWQVGDKHYVAFTASLDADTADRHIAAEQAAASAKAAEKVAATASAKKAPGTEEPVEEPAGKPAVATDPAKDREHRLLALNSEVESLNAAFKGWSFILPAHKIGNIDKRMEDLLKPLEEKVPAKTGKAGTPGN
ncbi:MAG: DUF4340 domain-containing protein [Dokdonella sp.]|uniref:DUF4340 domain-containing protein n=1 Tax=Dokdonella sp. TaxID=2291710 RepID=UPI002BE31541|nr:DUF4340 domain-containing protein [Dokdonella sp.]HOX71246.1 DUF4340 domain-containing protein [Dokdonella sp.]HPG93663.1 DUF4340 domain-containing protein [Dokdonella sp.]HPN79028.1 DUF4340 domain-containing protein [Dokdonella sp.]